MRKRVILSGWCIAITALELIVLLVALYFAKDEMQGYVIAGALIVLCLTALFYMPVSISVAEGNLNINRPLHTKSIPLSSIEAVEPISPTMAERRICGSGGLFGYYGWMKEPSIGKYFAYYGKSSDCFLITLKDGQKYLLGCEDKDEIIALINRHLG